MEGKQSPNNGILKAKYLPEPQILCFLVPLIIRTKHNTVLLTFSLPPNCSWQMEPNDQILLEKAPRNSSIRHLITKTMGHFVTWPNA